MIPRYACISCRRPIETQLHHPNYGAKQMREPVCDRCHAEIKHGRYNPHTQAEALMLPRVELQKGTNTWAFRFSPVLLGLNWRAVRSAYLVGITDEKVLTALKGDMDERVSAAWAHYRQQPEASLPVPFTACAHIDGVRAVFYDYFTVVIPSLLWLRDSITRSNQRKDIVDVLNASLARIHRVIADAGWADLVGTKALAEAAGSTFEEQRAREYLQAAPFAPERLLTALEWADKRLSINMRSGGLPGTRKARITVLGEIRTELFGPAEEKVPQRMGGQIIDVSVAPACQWEDAWRVMVERHNSALQQL